MEDSLPFFKYDSEVTSEVALEYLAATSLPTSSAIFCCPAALRSPRGCDRRAQRL